MDHPIVHDSVCRNCSAALTGPYCAHCGQHAHESARSLHVLFHDAWHLITHLDGRVWATLVPLMIRPGTLTREYFADHRARFAPPFRLYFIISVAFFALASLSSGLSDLVVHRGTLSAADRAELQQQLHASEIPATIGSSVDLAPSNPLTPTAAAQLCARVATGTAWFDARLHAVCERQLSDQGKSMMHEFAALVPKMMFVFLPLMALVMLALYHNPRRYYVEHLVFLLHVQSCLFLTMIATMLLSAWGRVWPLFDPVASLAGVILFWYAVWYVLSALHTYYGQGWPRTAVKFVAVAVAYLACFTLTLGGTMVISALMT